MKSEKCQLFSCEAIKKIMEQLPGGAKGSYIILYSFALGLGQP